MEYLEMRGAVKLKADANRAEVVSILGDLSTIEFNDYGHVCIQLDVDNLNVDIEGPIREFHNIKILLAKLQCQLSETSVIGVTRERWEVYVVLREWEPSTKLQLLPVVA